MWHHVIKWLRRNTHKKTSKKANRMHTYARFNCGQFALATRRKCEHQHLVTNSKSISIDSISVSECNSNKNQKIEYRKLQKLLNFIGLAPFHNVSTNSICFSSIQVTIGVSCNSRYRLSALFSNWHFSFYLIFIWQHYFWLLEFEYDSIHSSWLK